jgi:hypothetical protein
MDSFLNTAFAKVSEKPGFNETGANTRDVHKVTTFLDIPNPGGVFLDSPLKA